jgi:YD repeat-containing protein
VPRGQVTKYSYDAAGQTTGWSSPDGTETVSQGFDALGDRASVSDATGSSSYSFDAVGRMTGATTAAGTVTYGYDGSGLRTDVTAAGAHVGYAYNGAGSARLGGRRVGDDVDGLHHRR